MMLDIPANWPALFDQVFESTAPANTSAIAEVLAPITPIEIAAVTAELRNPWPPESPNFASYRPLDPSSWSVPRSSIPDSYIAFLQWSDGATWQTGEREFSCFGCIDLREYMLQYHFPHYMPGALPIGLDGGGVFGVFDLRTSASDAVWAIGSGALSWMNAVKVANHFVDFCRDRTPVGEVYIDAFKAKQ